MGVKLKRNEQVNNKQQSSSFSCGSWSDFDQRRLLIHDVKNNNNELTPKDYTKAPKPDLPKKQNW